MSISLAFAWWVVPAVVTVVGILYALFVVDNRGYLGGLNTLFALAVAAAVSAVAWAVFGFLK